MNECPWADACGGAFAVNEKKIINKSMNIGLMVLKKSFNNP